MAQRSLEDIPDENPEKSYQL
jgi:hypothetical protein